MVRRPPSLGTRLPLARAVACLVVLSTITERKIFAGQQGKNLQQGRGPVDFTLLSGLRLVVNCVEEGTGRQEARNCPGPQLEGRAVTGNLD